MKVRLPVVIKDPTTSEYFNMPPTENFIAENEDFFLDGPVTERVAVLDFDPDTGMLVPGARFEPPGRGRTIGRYKIENPSDIHARDFNQVSVLAIILKTMRMFEEEDTLGRKLTWAFKAPQLLVVPRAGEWSNAFYERESHSLQFFYFRSLLDPSKVVYTSLSHDIIAHEAGHAILDGIAPGLYDSLTPQSLALHEALADLTALVMAFRSRLLRETALRHTGGSIRSSHAFSGIAEQFGMARDPSGRTIFLRDLSNDKTLVPRAPNSIARDDPHELSEVMSGALFNVMLKIHDDQKRRLAREEGRTAFQVSGKALAVGANRFKRMIFRALDYLPPGEVSFAEYGRAIIAADKASHPRDSKERKWIAEEFVRRGIVPSIKALEVKTDFEHAAVQDLDLQTLINSDWAAYDFANRNRKLLGIPEGIHFHVWPRLDTTKRYYQRGNQRDIRECIFKVAWDHNENNRLGTYFPRQRQITLGTTLALDWETRRVRALLTSAAAADGPRADRDLMLKRLAESGVLRVGEEANGPNGKPLRSAIRAEIMGNLMRVRGAARMLHLVKEA